MTLMRWMTATMLAGVLLAGAAMAETQCCDCQTFCVERPVIVGCGKCKVKNAGTCPKPCGVQPKLTRPIRKHK